MNPWPGIGAVCGALGFLLWSVAELGRRAGWSGELSRKVVHVVMGLTCLSFPWVFGEAWAVAVLAGIATAGLLAVRTVPAIRQRLGSSLHGIGRTSLGELLFAPAVALVFALSGDRVEYYLAAVGVLTLADAAGALAGTRWGVSRYGSGAGWKSVEGSAAFLLLAIGCVAVPLVMAGEMEPGKVLWISLTVGLLATMAEGLLDAGSDNLVLPLWVFFLLTRLAELDEGTLMIRCGTVVGLLVLVVVLGKRSTLDGAALLSAALLGYGLAVLGGAVFLVPGLTVFAVHLGTTWRHRLLAELRHGREPVFAVALATLPWAAARPWVGGEVALLGCGLGAGGMLWMMHLATGRHLGAAGPAVGRGLLKFGLVIVPVAGWIGWELSWRGALAGSLLALGAGWNVVRREEEGGLPRVARGVFALAASLAALWPGVLTGVD